MGKEYYKKVDKEISYCTWLGCNKNAEYQMMDKFDKPWACLCKEHFDIHEEAVRKGIQEGGTENIKKMLSAWVKAHGGAKKAAKDLLGG